MLSQSVPPSWAVHNVVVLWGHFNHQITDLSLQDMEDLGVENNSKLKSGRATLVPLICQITWMRENMDLLLSVLLSVILMLPLLQAAVPEPTLNAAEQEAPMLTLNLKAGVMLFWGSITCPALDLQPLPPEQKSRNITITIKPLVANM